MVACICSDKNPSDSFNSYEQSLIKTYINRCINSLLYYVRSNTIRDPMLSEMSHTTACLNLPAAWRRPPPAPGAGLPVCAAPRGSRPGAAPAGPPGSRAACAPPSAGHPAPP